MNKLGKGISRPVAIILIVTFVIAGGGVVYYIGGTQRVIQIDETRNGTQLGQPSLLGATPAPLFTGAAGKPPQGAPASGSADLQIVQNLRATNTQLESSLNSRDLALQDESKQIANLSQALSALKAKQAQSDALIGTLESKLKSIQALTVGYQNNIDALDKQIAAIQTRNLQDITSSQGQPLSLSAISKLIADANYQIDQLDAQKDQLRQEFTAKLNALGVN